MSNMQKYAKISWRVCNLDFMDRIYITLGYNFSYTKKICKIISVRALVMNKTVLYCAKSTLPHVS